MNVYPTEYRYQKEIIKHLSSKEFDGLKYTYLRENQYQYDRQRCIIPSETLKYIEDTQPETYKKIIGLGKDPEIFISNLLDSNIKRDGLIFTLKNGVDDFDVGHIDLITFNPDRVDISQSYIEKYKKNRFNIIDEFKYSVKNENRIDIVLVINGIPILTMELKNQFTGQTVLDSDKQYVYDRKPDNEPLLQFRRCIGHFSLDKSEIHFTTSLNGEKTKFFPFNKGIDINEKGYKVSFLWEEVFNPVSLLDIIEKFVVEVTEFKKEWNDKTQRVEREENDVLIFPRYHQLEVIRNLRDQVKKDNVGKNYLIQHTTGSGKSYSIGWLSHNLISLFDDNDNRIFDSIIVITDRIVLDNQLTKTLTDLQGVEGVVKSTENSTELRKYLEIGGSIIISTIQKFSVVVKSIEELSGKRFGVIIDEVHSSQTGQNNLNLRKVLSINEEEEDEITTSQLQDYTNQLIKTLSEQQRSRKKPPNISFFGFTGTPKPETIEIFGTETIVDGNVVKVPFHSYTMRQSIKEGFTLDVLENFTSVKRWFKLKLKGDDKELPESKVKQQLVRGVDSSPEMISEKVRIILNHLTTKTFNTIPKKLSNGKTQYRGKGMVVCSSQYDVVQYFFEITKQLKEIGIYHKCKPLCGFSGKILYQGEKFVESDLNQKSGLLNRESIPDGFKNPLNRILIVCSKFQTGFDEPLLHSMFIDKKLSGVQCVQTLSRLNRTTSGKEETFVLDFVNKPDDVQKSFQDFYQTIILSEETDKNELFGILNDIKGFRLFRPTQVTEWLDIYFRKNRSDKDLQPFIDSIYNQWLELIEEDRIRFRSKVGSFHKMYEYITQVVDLKDRPELEGYYLFFSILHRFLTTSSPPQRLDIMKMVSIESYKFDEQENVSLFLEEKDKENKTRSWDSDGRIIDEESDLLSNIIREMNEVLGEGLPEEFIKPLEEITKQIEGHEEFGSTMRNNTESNSRDWLEKLYREINKGNINKDIERYKFFKSDQVKDLIIQTVIRDNRQNI